MFPRVVNQRKNEQDEIALKVVFIVRRNSDSVILIFRRTAACTYLENCFVPGLLVNDQTKATL